MYQFPLRTWQSDLHLKHVSDALDRVSGGKNFMVSVVPALSGQIYVALSGTTRGVLEQKLRDELSFSKSLVPDYKLAKKEESALDKLKKNQTVSEAERAEARKKLQLSGAVKSLSNAPTRGLGVYVVVGTLSEMNGSLIDSDRQSVRGRIQAYEARIRSEASGASSSAPGRPASLDERNNPLRYPASRDCSEPKVLQGVRDAGDRAFGMSTMWYGTQANPFPDTVGGGHGLSYARPCDFCRLNEQRIMLRMGR